MKNILLMIETDAMFLWLTLIISLIIMLFSISLFFSYSFEKNKQKKIMFLGFFNIWSSFVYSTVSSIT